ncbi:hypothetical protein EYZ11_012705 [Aspergillus tanneri]|uniref:Hemimethylated DNA-binding domain-containing protein n=1 Tax=Aspergillus tanneri TaxID=1220188 RepID=A0A4S3J4Y6_9EURO|nr:hypothetical protein EYZ11_012705 [Aspergillus tanneri]
MAIASCLRGDNLMGIGAGREYHSLEHNFLGVALNDSEHNSLPLISAAIYCYVAQRLGLNARPCLVDIDSAKYAAVWSAVLLTDPSQPAASRHHLPWLMELFATEFPSDAFLIEEYVAPLFLGMREHDHILESLHVMRAVDEMPKQIKRRALHNGSIKYQIGQVFRHRRYDYKAVITGWDIECDAGDQWVRQMGIDRLQHGRHQSFYHVLVEDRSVRYVAEENIDPMSPPISELPVSLTSAAGKHFRRWDTGARRFVSNIRDEYPDD